MQRVAPVLALIALTGCDGRDLGMLAYLLFELWPATLCAVLAIGVPAAAFADVILRRRIGHKA